MNFAKIFMLGMLLTTVTLSYAGEDDEEEEDPEEEEVARFLEITQGGIEDR